MTSKGYQMEVVKKWAVPALLALLVAYGWMPVCWAICKLAGWV